MKPLFTITLAIITFSLTQCEKAIENKMYSDTLTTTTATTSTLEEEDDDQDRSKFDVMAAMIECNDTFRVELAFLESFNQSGSFPDETDKTPKCFVRCVLEKSEVASEDSQFNVTRTAEVFPQIRDIPQDDIIKMATVCVERPEKCKCERAYQYLKCLMEMAIDINENT